MRQIEPSLAEMSDDEIGQLLDLLAEDACAWIGVDARCIRSDPQKNC
jgi:hypothetical protein